MGAAVTGYGLWEKNQFVLREETLPILPAGFGPIRVLHLSDIHFVPGQHRKADWLASLAELRPDLVVNTGDNLSHAKSVQPLLDSLHPLMEFPGVFVPGSNDYFAPTLKNPVSYFQGPVLAHQGTGPAGLAPAPCRLRHGRLGGPDQPLPVAGDQRPAR